jgi:hypothetical protein
MSRHAVDHAVTFFYGSSILNIDTARINHAKILFLKMLAERRFDDDQIVDGIIFRTKGNNTYLIELYEEESCDRIQAV